MHIQLFLSLLSLMALPGHDGSGQRGLLWRVVQACVLNHTMTGASFPCLAVDAKNGIGSGYAVLRAPNEGVRVIVTPTVRTPGIEADRLRGTTAPNYFQDAWTARHFVTDHLVRKPNRSDLALAINSKPGRSQDQLHIHVACVQPDVKRAVARMNDIIHGGTWTAIKVLPYAPHYWAHFEPGRDLSGINVFDRVAAGLKIVDGKMEGATIVVVGAEPSGFMILARTRLARVFDEPHGEALLDPDCESFQAP